MNDDGPSRARGNRESSQEALASERKTDDACAEETAELAELTRAKEDALRAYARMDMAEELAAMGSWEVDVVSGRRFWSRNMFRLLGIEPVDPPPDDAALAELIHPDDRASLPCAHAQFQEEAGEGTVEFRRNPAAGEPRHFRMSWTCLRDERGNPRLIRGVLRDITERKTAEEVLRASEAKYRSLFNQSIEGIYLHDLDGKIVDVNRMACAQSASTREQLLQMSVFDLLPSRFGEEEIRQQWREWETDQRFTIEGAHLDADGNEYPVEISTGKIRYEGQELMLAIVRDISERKRAEEEQELLQEQLRQAQKMESVGRLAGGVAHDFNNVLCAITGHAGLARRSLSPADPLHASMTEILGAADRAADLTQQLLAFSRKQVIDPKVIDLGDAIGQLESMLSRLIGEDILLRISSARGAGPVRVDPVQIEQLVLNLAVNARDAMPNGGTLLLETSEVELDAAYCSAHAGVEPGAYVMLAVSDTGVGMDASIRDKIFEPFFTTKELGLGTGLGLATVFGIVAQHRGQIEVYSELGKGTTFKIYFPCVSGAVQPSTRSETREVRGGTETVLLVEDEEMVRRTATRLLERLGYAVLSAGSGEDALWMAERHEGPIDLLLTDVVMPRLNGRELAQRLTASRPALRVLYTSGYTPDIIAHHGVLDEGVQFLAKPYSLDKLAARVREVLDTPADS